MIEGLMRFRRRNTDSDLRSHIRRWLSDGSQRSKAAAIREALRTDRLDLMAVRLAASLGDVAAASVVEPLSVPELWTSLEQRAAKSDGWRIGAPRTFLDESISSEIERDYGDRIDIVDFACRPDWEDQSDPARTLRPSEVVTRESLDHLRGRILEAAKVGDQLAIRALLKLRDDEGFGRYAEMTLGKHQLADLLRDSWHMGIGRDTQDFHVVQRIRPIVHDAFEVNVIDALLGFRRPQWRSGLEVGDAIRFGQHQAAHVVDPSKMAAGQARDKDQEEAILDEVGSRPMTIVLDNEYFHSLTDVSSMWPRIFQAISGAAFRVEELARQSDIDQVWIFTTFDSHSLVTGLKRIGYEIFDSGDEANDYAFCFLRKNLV